MIVYRVGERAESVALVGCVANKGPFFLRRATYCFILRYFSLSPHDRQTVRPTSTSAVHSFFLSDTSDP